MCVYENCNNEKVYAITKYGNYCKLHFKLAKPYLDKKDIEWLYKEKSMEPIYNLAG